MEWPRAIWYLLQKYIILLDLKAIVLSLMSLVGNPNLDRILVSRKVMITISMTCLEGMASIHFVKYSVVVRIHLY